MIEGPIDKVNFFEKRAGYFSETYNVSVEDYHEKSTSQFEKIKLIPENSEIYLWFEDDLFCQCNMWFVINVLLKGSLKANIYLIRPTSDSWFGFGAMDKNLFAQAYKNKVLLNQEQLLDFQKLWLIYTQEIKEDPKEIAERLKTLIPRLPQVLKAHLDRIPPMNRPLDSIKKILVESNDKSFASIFKEFSKREGIYGFGDTSIKIMYNQLINQT